MAQTAIVAGEPAIIDGVEYIEPQKCHICGEWVECGGPDNSAAYPITCLQCYEDMEDPDSTFGPFQRHCYPLTYPI